MAHEHNRKGTISYVPKLPTCDIHKHVKGKANVIAKYDGRTKDGPWAMMCQSCFDEHGIGLGIGRGQELLLIENPSEDEARDMVKDFLTAVDKDVAETRKQQTAAAKKGRRVGHMQGVVTVRPKRGAAKKAAMNKALEAADTMHQPEASDNLSPADAVQETVDS